MDCHIEIFLDNSWKTAAVFEPNPATLDQGIAGGGRLEYDIDYAMTYIGNMEAELAPGLPVGFELFRFDHWPPFLVDLLPGGAGRRAWLRRMQAENDGPQMDWHLLIKGAGAPPGNLRIAEAAPTPPSDHFKIGFPRRDIIEQRERFLDYAEERGAHVAGASSVQGEAPKYLLAQDFMEPSETRAWLADLGEDVKKLPETMADCHVDDIIIERLTGWIDDVATGLIEAGPKSKIRRT